MKSTTNLAESSDRNGVRQAFELTREIALDENQSASAFRSHVRSREQMARLPFGKIRATVLRRLDAPRDKLRKPTAASIQTGKVRCRLSDFQREDANQLVCIACHVLGIADNAFPTIGQWKEIFRSVRKGLGTDREAKRAGLVEIISLQPELMEMLNVACPPASEDEPDTDRIRIVAIVQDTHRKLIAAFQADTSRKRKARFLTAVRFLRRLTALKSGKSISEPLFNGTSDGCANTVVCRFREYIAAGEIEMQRRESVLIEGEFKSFDAITLGFTSCNLKHAA